MNVYLSTSSADLALAQNMMKAIQNHGHTVALDWTATFQKPESRWGDLVGQEILAVQGAEVVLLVGEPTPGCYVEVGAALASGVPVVWLRGRSTQDTKHFFFYSPLVLVVRGIFSEALQVLNWMEGTK